MSFKEKHQKDKVSKAPGLRQVVCWVYCLKQHLKIVLFDSSFADLLAYLDNFAIACCAMELPIWEPQQAITDRTANDRVIRGMVFMPN